MHTDGTGSFLHSFLKQCTIGRLRSRLESAEFGLCKALTMFIQDSRATIKHSLRLEKWKMTGTVYGLNDQLIS